MHKVKRECKSQWIKHKQRDLFRDSSTQLYVPAFTQKDFQSTNLPHRTPTQGTSTEDLGQQQPGVHNSSLNYKHNLSLEARHKATTNTTSHKRGRHLANTTNHLTLEGFQHKPPPLTRGSQTPISTSH